MSQVDLYLRLSVRRDDSDSIERQEKELRAWAEREGLTVRKVWKDDGKSGYKRGVVRESFNAAVEAVTRGEVATLAVWKLDRLSRRGAGQVGLVLDDIEAVGGRLYFLRDSLDSTIPGHRMVIVVVSEQARAESANTSVRVTSTNDDRREKGLPPAGKRRFGYLPGERGKRLVNTKEHPTEGPIVRDLFRRAAAGTPLLRLSKESGKALNTVRRILTNKAYAGFVPIGVYETDPKTGKNREVSRSYVEAAPEVDRLIDLDTFEAVQSLLADPARKTAPGNQRKHDASGIAQCGECGATLQARHKAYGCPNSYGHPTIYRHLLDPLLEGEALSYLLALPEPEDSAEVATVAAERAALEEKRRKVQSMATWEGVDLEDIRRQVSEIGREIAKVTDRLDALRVQTVADGLVTKLREEIRTHADDLSLDADEEMAAWWHGYWTGLPLDHRREVLSQLDIVLGYGRGVDRVTVQPR